MASIGFCGGQIYPLFLFGGEVGYTATTSVMTKETLVFVTGMLLTLIPFLGIPEAWRQYAVAGLGFVLILIGYALRRAVYLAKIDKGNGERGTDSFVETTEPLFKDSELQ